MGGTAYTGHERKDARHCATRTRAVLKSEFGRKVPLASSFCTSGETKLSWEGAAFRPSPGHEESVDGEGAVADGLEEQLLLHEPAQFHVVCGQTHTHTYSYTCAPGCLHLWRAFLCGPEIAASATSGVVTTRRLGDDHHVQDQEAGVAPSRRFRVRTAGRVPARFAPRALMAPRRRARPAGRACRAALPREAREPAA